MVMDLLQRTTHAQGLRVYSIIFAVQYMLKRNMNLSSELYTVAQNHCLSRNVYLSEAIL